MNKLTPEQLEELSVHNIIAKAEANRCTQKGCKKMKFAEPSPLKMKCSKCDAYILATYRY